MRTFWLYRVRARLPDLTGGKGGCVDRGSGQRVDEALQSVPPELAEVVFLANSEQRTGKYARRW